MSAVDDLFSRGLPKGAMVIVIPPHGGESDDVEIGTPFSFRDGIAPDGRGDDDIPLDHPSDCSSFIANLIAHLSGDKIKLPAFTDDMADELPEIPMEDARPGDIALEAYQGQGPVRYGHVGMLTDTDGASLDDWRMLDQSTSDEGPIGRPGVDIRPVTHPFEQGGMITFRRVPGLYR